MKTDIVLSDNDQEIYDQMLEQTPPKGFNPTHRVLWKAGDVIMAKNDSQQLAIAKTDNHKYKSGSKPFVPYKNRSEIIWIEVDLIPQNITVRSNKDDWMKADPDTIVKRRLKRTE
jgi:hypothetical protein